MPESDPATTVIGEAVLRDYPLRLWAEQQEHMDALLREFQLLVTGEQTGMSTNDVPKRLVDLAETFTERFGPLIAAINEERQHAYDAGKDRIDSHVPLVPGLPALLEQVRLVLADVDEYCRAGELLVLPRPPHLVELADWTREELVRQFHGGEPRPWPGPF